MNEKVLAWRYSYNGMSWAATANPSFARELIDEGYTVTPLVSAPPEDGRPTYADLVDALQDVVAYAEEAAAGRWDVPHDLPVQVEDARALLSRIPKEEP